jgi:hypothetical protein
MYIHRSGRFAESGIVPFDYLSPFSDLLDAFIEEKASMNPGPIILRAEFCVGILEGMDEDEVEIGGPEVVGSEEAEEDMVFLCGQRVFF